jgi:hypothetical protein
LMYAQSFLVTSVRGNGLLPTTSANCGLGVMGAINAAFGLRPLLFFALFADFAVFAVFAFFAVLAFFALAICSPIE